MPRSRTVTTRKLTDTARIAGVQKYCLAQASILIEGTAYTPTQVIAIYQNDLDALAAVTAAEQALDEVRTQAAATAGIRDAFDKGFKQAILGAYGNSTTTLGTFGIAVATPAVRSTAKKAAAVAKAKATRALKAAPTQNQTTSTGSVPGVVATSTAPAASGGASHS